MSTVSKLLLQILKPIVVAKLAQIADDITPEDIEEKLDLDGFFHKLEVDPKYADLAPFLEQLEAQGEDAQKQLAILIDAVLDLLVVYTASRL
jgi:hypothetical protein